VPFLQQKWVQAVGILAVLGVLFFGVYLALRPPSPEKLYAAIEKANSPDARLEAAARFLDAHGAKGGELTDKAAAVFREATVKAREKQLDKRFHNQLTKPDDGDDPEAYSATWDAMGAEKAGQLELAEAQWRKVKGRFPDEAKLPYATTGDPLARARWAWVADKRLADIAGARAELAQLRKKIDDSRVFEQPLKNDPASPESLALRTLRLSAFGDGERAGRECDALISLTEKDPEKHTWYLLGTLLKRALPKVSATPRETRLDELDKALARAKKQAKVLEAEPENGVERRNLLYMCREVTELYEDDSDKDVQVRVKQAAGLAASIQKK
jgi:hypothetical protein